MSRMWRLSLVVAISLSSAAALPKPQEHGQGEHNMELGNIDNVGVMSQTRIMRGFVNIEKLPYVIGVIRLSLIQLGELYDAFILIP